MGRHKSTEKKEKVVATLDEDASRLLGVLVQLTKLSKSVIVSEAIKTYAQANYEKLKQERESRDSLFEF